MVSGVAKDSQKKKTTWIRRTGLTEVGHGFISEAATLSHQRLVWCATRPRTRYKDKLYLRHDHSPPYNAIILPPGGCLPTLLSFSSRLTLRRVLVFISRSRLLAFHSLICTFNVSVSLSYLCHLCKDSSVRLSSSLWLQPAGNKNDSAYVQRFQEAGLS